MIDIISDVTMSTPDRLNVPLCLLFPPKLLEIHNNRKLSSIFMKQMIYSVSQVTSRIELFLFCSIIVLEFSQNILEEVHFIQLKQRASFSEYIKLNYLIKSNAHPLQNINSVHISCALCVTHTLTTRL